MVDQLQRDPFYIQVLNSIAYANPPTLEAELVRTMGPAAAMMIGILIGERAIERVMVPGEVSYFIVTPIGFAELARVGQPFTPEPLPQFLPEPVLLAARCLTETTGTASLFADALLNAASINITLGYATDIVDVDRLTAASVNETIGYATDIVDVDRLVAESVNETLGEAKIYVEYYLEAASVTETAGVAVLTSEADLSCSSITETSGNAAMTVCSANSIAGLVGDFNGDLDYGDGVWLDQSDEGNDLTLIGTQAGGGLNGYGTVLFSGALDKTTRASFSLNGGSELTIFFVGEVVSSTALGKILSYDGIKHMLVENILSGDNPQYVNGVSTAVGGGIVGAFHILCARDTGVLLTGEIDLFIDGFSTGTPSIPLNTVASSAAFAIGGLGLNFSNIDVARVLVYNRDLTAAERALVTEMLACVYGL